MKALLAIDGQAAVPSDGTREQVAKDLVLLFEAAREFHIDQSTLVVALDAYKLLTEGTPGVTNTCINSCDFTGKNNPTPTKENK